MGEFLRNSGVVVARPAKCAEVRIGGVDPSTTPDVVATAIARDGGCRPGEVRVGEIRTAPSGRRIAWVRCPAAAAHRVVAAVIVKVG
ncbi:hypothetical protein P5V15_015808 [Pogonomyrmex californicus]